MVAERVQALASVLRRLLAVGTASADERLGRHADALRPAGRKVAALGGLVGLIEELETAHARGRPRAFLDVLLRTQLISYGLAAAGCEGTLERVAPSGPWVTDRSSAELAPVVAAAAEPRLPRRSRLLSDALRRLGQDGPLDMRLVGPVLHGAFTVFDQTARWMIANELPRFGRALLPEFRREFHTDGDEADARRLAAISHLDPKEGLRLSRAALEEGSDPVRVAALEALTRLAPDEAARTALDLLGRKKVPARLKKAALTALAASKEDAALEALIAALGSHSVGWEAYSALRKTAHPRTLPRLLETLADVVASFDRTESDTAPKVSTWSRKTSHLYRLLSLVNDKRDATGFLTTMKLRDHPAPDVQRVATSILESLANNAPGLVAPLDELIALLNDRRPKVRLLGVQLIGRGGPEAAAAVPHVLSRLRDRDAEVRAAVPSALRRIGAPPGEAVPALRRALRDLSDNVRNHVIWCLGEYGPAAKSTVPALIAVLRDRTDPMRSSVPEALVRIAPDSPAVLRALIDALDDGPRFAGWAVRGLRALGPAAAAAVPDLRPLLGAEDGWVRWMAVEALGAIGPAAAEAVPDLIPRLRETDRSYGYYIRPEAARTLGKIGPAARAAVPALAEIRRGANKQLREAISEALAAIEGPTPAGRE